LFWVCGDYIGANKRLEEQIFEISEARVRNPFLGISFHIWSVRLFSSTDEPGRVSERLVHVCKYYTHAACDFEV